MKYFWAIAVLLISGVLYADQLRVAVASNFEPTLRQLADIYEVNTGQEISIISGSTGQLYAQIKHGAPYDVFMAADTKRPQLLLADETATDYYVYAQGELILVANKSDCDGAFNFGELDYLAIADPSLAPYGLAAKQYLLSINQWDNLQAKLVIGTNTAQALHMVFSGNARAGLVAQSLIVNHPTGESLCQKPVPEMAYQPIKQAMVFLKRSTQKDQILAFKQFLQTEQAQDLILKNGYSIEHMP